MTLVQRHPDTSGHKHSLLEIGFTKSDNKVLVGFAACTTMLY